ncbi:MAG: hypothetical protein COV35_06390 [Alphaproteobacteria bacterium CG11_big_fil_rev_8_21_14_0_20_39_49]|nr:MAG: hypothetical protein COV35_06390 [Alphaproteobacteria bacterium CG11_big_fil_rev_8_21_14_0_20_39_49]
MDTDSQSNPTPNSPPSSNASSSERSQESSDFSLSSFSESSEESSVSSEEQSQSGISLQEINSEESTQSQNTPPQEVADIENQIAPQTHAQNLIRQKEIQRRQDIKRTIKSTLEAEFIDLMSEDPSERLEDLKDIIKESKNISNKSRTNEDQGFIEGTLSAILKQHESVDTHRFEPSRSQARRQESEDALSKEELAQYTKEVVMDMVYESVNGTLDAERAESEYGIRFPQIKEPLTREQLEDVYKATSGSESNYEKNKEDKNLPLLERSDMNYTDSALSKFLDYTKNPTISDKAALSSASIAGFLVAAISQVGVGAFDDYSSLEHYRNSRTPDTGNSTGTGNELGYADYAEDFAKDVGIAAGKTLAGSLGLAALAALGIIANNIRKARPEKEPESQDSPTVTRAGYEQNIQQEVSSRRTDIPLGADEGDLSHVERIQRQNSSQSLGNMSV